MAVSGWIPVAKLSVGSNAVKVEDHGVYLHMMTIYNTTAAVAYVQIFNAKSSAVTTGTTDHAIAIPVSATDNDTVQWQGGLRLENGMAIAATTTPTGSTTAACHVFMGIG